MKKILFLVGGVLLLGIVGVAGFLIISKSSAPDLTAQPGRSFAKFSVDHPSSTLGNLGLQLIFNSIGSPIARIQSNMELIQKFAPKWTAEGGDMAQLQSIMAKVSVFGDQGNFVEAEKTTEEILTLIGASPDVKAEASLEVHRSERDSLIADALKFRLSGIEEYIGWTVTEPEAGNREWKQYREDAVAIRDAGLDLVAFLWIQTLPKWVKDDPSTVYTSNVETGLSAEHLSIFAPSSHKAYDHFFGEAKRELGNLIDTVRIGSPNDFGETSYVGANANQFFPMENLAYGFWVNEAPARTHFKETMQTKYESVARLNAAWGTSFADFASIDYPKDVKNRRYWLDFIHWYHDGFTEMMGVIGGIAKSHFGDTPVNINLGWPWEKINLGQSLSGITKMSAEKGLYLRTPTGPIVPFLYTKRVATAARHYVPPGFSSEPVDSSASCADMALAYFKDLTTGVSWHFDYGSNYDRCQQSFGDYRTLWMANRYPNINAALFFPTTSHYLENWNTWRPDGFSGGFPAGLQDYAEELRDVLDYDVLDERLVADGFLDGYDFLIWPVGQTVESLTLEKVALWTKNGGTLLVADLNGIEAVEGGQGAFAELAALQAQNGVKQFGKGRIIDISRKVSGLSGVYPADLDVRDKVLVSTFEHGMLVFNNSNETVLKTVMFKGTTTDLSLTPYQFTWVK